MKLNNIQLNICESRQQWLTSATNSCFEQLNSSLQQQHSACFIVPGGTTPAPIFERLSNTNLEWENVTIALSDERWIAPDHPQSNQKLVTESLLINHAAKAKLIPMKNTHSSPLEGQKQANDSYAFCQKPFSLTLLGMGSDGHFASLFPNAKNIDDAMEPNNSQTCVAIDATDCKVAGEFTQRMSLSLNGILQSQLIILLVTGKDKLDVLENAAEHYNVKKYPISALLHQTSTPLKIYWCE